jgi:hypothetical protein
LRFAVYGRVSTEDWQDPVTSRARQHDQAAALVAGHGMIVAEFFDVGESRALAWPRRPQAAALMAALADPDRGWDAIVIGEYERAFYGGQYASMAPEDTGSRARFLIRDRDREFPSLFDTVLKDAGIDVVLSGGRMPRMNAIMERWVQACQHEMLDRTLIWNQRHLLHALREFEHF